MIAPLDYAEIANSEQAIYRMQVWVQDGCGVSPANGYWCGSCIRQCWVAGTGATAKHSPFGDNTQIIEPVDGKTCARCAAFKAVR